MPQAGAVSGPTPAVLSEEQERQLSFLRIQGVSPMDRALKIAEAHGTPLARAAFLPRIGDMRGSIAAHRESLASRPANHRIVLESLIQMIDRETGTTIEDARAMREEWWREYGFTVPMPSYPQSRDSERPLRVGYVSANFKHSSAGNCLEAILLRHSDAVEVYAYSTMPPVAHDPSSWAFEVRVKSFVDVSGLTEAQTAARIRADQIDILIDCMGFTYGNRLQAFCERPAPIQITGWGYATGTVPCMDYILLDAITAGQDRFYERVLQLPCVITYALPQGVEPIAPAPTGPVTFGAFHCFIKINDDVLRVWRQIIDAVPGSRIVFKGKEYGEALLQARIRQHLGADRCEFWPQSHQLAHLAAFKHVDLVLDPWPQTGGITTCEALCMGVPSVTKLGPRTIERAAGAILDAVGFHQGIAVGDADYIARAVDLVTTKRAWLAAQRSSWRERLMASRVIAGYVPAVEALYRSLWRDYCAIKESAA